MNEMDRTLSKHLTETKGKSTSATKPKRKPKDSVLSKKRNRSHKSLKKRLKRSAGRKFFLYKYEMKACLTWEFAETFQNIDNWHDSLKGEDAETKPVKDELQLKSEDNKVNMSVNQSATKNINTRYNNQNGNAVLTEDKHISTERSTTTTSDTLMEKINTDYDQEKSNTLLTEKERTAAEKSTATAIINSSMMEDSAPLIHRGIGTAHGRETSHQRSHFSEKSFKCQHCSKTFSTHYTLKTHLVVHTDMRPFKCTKCPKMYSQRGHLTRHKHIHSGKKLFKCTQCPKTFSRNPSLTIHLRSHSGERPYKCTECPKTYAKGSHLWRHNRIHTGEKPYKCIHCPKEFAEKSVWATHSRIHSGEKPFECPHCSKKFSDRSNLKSHLRTQKKKTRTSKR